MKIAIPDLCVVALVGVSGSGKSTFASRHFLPTEGFRNVVVLRGVDDIDRAEVVRERLWTDKTDLTGPFDIIGDVHGCHAELVDLLVRLGWSVEPAGDHATNPAGRTAVFLGD